MKRLLLKFGLRSEPWPWIRASLALVIVLLAVLVWNPHLTIPGFWDSRKRGGYDQQRKDGIAIVVLGAMFIGCVESVRKRSR